MNKSQLVDALAGRFDGNRRAARHALESVLDTISREVAKGEKVAITGFGSFEKKVREARWVRNPRTGERVKAKKTAVPKFNAGAELKAVVSGAKKLPKLTLGTVGKKSAAPSAAAAATRAGSSGSGGKTASASTGAGRKRAAKSPAAGTSGEDTGPAEASATEST